MKSMLFAAGLGTRLRPYTNDRPKALVEVGGKPLLLWALEKLTAAGSREIILNVHHFADLILDFVQNQKNIKADITISDEREQVLETGGGLKKAAWFFNDDQPFLLTNVDILTSMDLAAFYKKHLNSNALATLAVRSRPSSRNFLFDENMQLSGWRDARTGETKPSGLDSDYLRPFAFSGLHVVSPRIFHYMPDEEKFSIVEVYLRAMNEEQITGHLHDADFWLDVGSPASLEAAEKWVRLRQK